MKERAKRAKIHDCRPRLAPSYRIVAGSVALRRLVCYMYPQAKTIDGLTWLACFVGTLHQCIFSIAPAFVMTTLIPRLDLCPKYHAIFLPQSKKLENCWGHVMHLSESTKISPMLAQERVCVRESKVPSTTYRWYSPRKPCRREDRRSST